jgi:hypothetical protein
MPIIRIKEKSGGTFSGNPDTQMYILPNGKPVRLDSPEGRAAIETMSGRVVNKNELSEVTSPTFTYRDFSDPSRPEGVVKQGGGETVGLYGDARKSYLTQRAKDVANQQYTAQQNAYLQAQRQAAQRQGQEFGNRLFYDGALGRVDAERSKEQDDILSRRQGNLQGLESQDNQALKESTFRDFNNQSVAANRNLQGNLNRSGIRGGAAVAAQNQLAEQQAKQAGQLGQDLLVKNVDYKNRALDAYENTYGGQRTDIYNRQLQNLSQKNKELQGRASSELGFIGLDAATQGQIQSKILGSETADSIKNSGGGGGKK